MNLLYRLLTGKNGPNYSPSSSPIPGGSPGLANLLNSHQQAMGSATTGTLAAPMAAIPYTSPGYLDIPLVTQAFGALPTGFGVATKEGRIQVDSLALEGTIDGGSYGA